MKLRNKKTGEIGNLKPYGGDGKIWVWIRNRSEPEYRYDSLAELNKEWKDYEEPKEYWFIDPGVSGNVASLEFYSDETRENMKKIGFDFDTKEEAEKAVEKLKAWKRLKDKGLVFKGINMYDGNIKTGLSKGVSLGDCEEFYSDMELLFGGEE